MGALGTRVLDTGEDGSGAEGQVSSMYGWSDHTLPVTGVLAGSGGPSAIVVSCSLDHTCKVISRLFFFFFFSMIIFSSRHHIGISFNS